MRTHLRGFDSRGRSNPREHRGGSGTDDVLGGVQFGPNGPLRVQTARGDGTQRGKVVPMSVPTVDCVITSAGPAEEGWRDRVGRNVLRTRPRPHQLVGGRIDLHADTFDDLVVSDPMPPTPLDSSVVGEPKSRRTQASCALASRWIASRRRTCSEGRRPNPHSVEMPNSVRCFRAASIRAAVPSRPSV